MPEIPGKLVADANTRQTNELIVLLNYDNPQRLSSLLPGVVKTSSKPATERLFLREINAVAGAAKTAFGSPAHARYLMAADRMSDDDRAKKSTDVRERMRREAATGKQSGRTLEIQRLIGRGLRAVTDMKGFGERQIVIDCDVIQADGGTRTASITGAFVALHKCFEMMKRDQLIKAIPLKDHVAAISCGIHNGAPALDLDYEEDSAAGTDANFVMTGAGALVEIQGTAEGEPFSEAEFLQLMALARAGIANLVVLQREAISRK